MSSDLACVRAPVVRGRCAAPRCRCAVVVGVLVVTSTSALIVSTGARAETSSDVTQVDLLGPTGSATFGQQVLVLSNGNYVVSDAEYDAGEVADVGAVHLYDGATDALISTTVGTHRNDYVGTYGVIEVANANFVIRSPDWDNGGIADAGAVTWVDGTTGLDGPVSPTNSLVGTHRNDYVGSYSVVEVGNGNFVIPSPDWDNGGLADAGAVTWGDGTTGLNGPVSATNSLVGTMADDRIGAPPMTVLTNGNYVVASSRWRNENAPAAGAVTWGDGTTGVTGPVTADNSLVGTQFGDQVGWGGGDPPVTALTNGNYVVSSVSWNNGDVLKAGAVTWGDGTTGVTGPVTVENSLVGSHADDQLGYMISGVGTTALTNGNYVVANRYWDNGDITDAGAVTWGDGTTGTTGPITADNSLVGTKLGDAVGSGQVAALVNGNYVATSPSWGDGTLNWSGAATWGDGSTGITGPITADNSLVGTRRGDSVGSAVTALTNGNYVVTSPNWANGGDAYAGAATWGDGSTGITGAVTTGNSLFGRYGDFVGDGGVTPLANGNYVVRSREWDDGAPKEYAFGAATWGDGTTGVAGLLTADNSLVGERTDSRLVTALTNGNYVVGSPRWERPNPNNDPNFPHRVGAATWADGTVGIAGTVTPENSLIGTRTDDYVGSGGVTALADGNYVVRASEWNNGAIRRAGAVTWGDGTTGLIGTVTPENSLVGTSNGDRISRGEVRALADGNYVVISDVSDSGDVVDAGAATLGTAGGVTGAVTSSNSAIGTPPGYVGPISRVGRLLTANDALPIPTTQGRVLLLLLDRSPTFVSPPPDVEVAAAPGASYATVTYPTPVAEDLRSTPTVGCTPPSGSTFPVGDTTVTCTATDSAGLTAATAFTVTVTATPVTELPSISIADASAVESAGSMTFDVSLDGPAPQTVLAFYVTFSRTARAYQDYIWRVIPVMIPRGETTATISVPLIDDTIEEADETFEVRLLLPIGALRGDGVATGTIFDDDTERTPIVESTDSTPSAGH